MFPINKMKWRKSHYITLIITIFLFALSLVIEPITLNVGILTGGGYGKLLPYILVKIGFFLFLWIVIQGMRKIFIDRIYGNAFIIIFCVITGIYLFFYFLVFPGIWMNDAKLVYDLAVNFEAMIGQHYFTTFIYLFALMLIPNAAAIPFAFLCLNSVMASYILYKVTKIIQKKKISRTYIVIIGIMLILPPVLYSVVFPLRNGVFGFLLTCVALAIQDIELSEIKKINLHWLNLGVAVMASLRSEAILILLIYLGFIVILSLKYLKTGKYVFSLMVFFLIIRIVGSAFYPVNENKIYRMTPFISPLSCMVSDDNIKITKDEIESIEKVVSIDLLKKHADHLGAHILYNEDSNNWNRYPEDKEYYGFVKAYIKIVLRNWDLFLKTRWDTFLALNRINMSYIIDSYRVREISSDNYPTDSGTVVGFSRQKVLDFLYLLDYKVENAGNNNYPIHILLWGSWIPLGLNMLGLLICLIKRKWVASLSLALPLIQAGVVFMLVIAPIPMFSFPFYLAGFIVPLYTYIKEKINHRDMGKI